MRMTSKQFAEYRVRTGAKVEKESDLHAAIIAELKARRIYFVHSRMDKAHTNGIGTTDFILAMSGGKTLWLEVKTAKGKLSREQAGVALLLTIAGHNHKVVRTFKDFTEAIA